MTHKLFFYLKLSNGIELTILRKVIPKLNSGSKPYSENSEASCFLATEPEGRGSEEEEGFRVSTWKWLEKPLKGFLTGRNTIFLDSKGGAAVVVVDEEGSGGFGGSVWITMVSAIAGVREASKSGNEGKRGRGEEQSHRSRVEREVIVEHGGY